MTCREFRKKYNYTLNDVSVATGYSISAISKYEREIDTMTNDFVEKIQKAYNVTIIKQFRKFIFNEHHKDIISTYQNELNELYEELDKISKENTILKEKLSKIYQICEEVK